MKWTSLKFSCIAVFLGIILHANHGAAYNIQNPIFAEETVLTSFNLPKFVNPSDNYKWKINTLMESSFFRKTFLPFYLEEIIDKLANNYPLLFKGVKDYDCIGNTERFLDLIRSKNFTGLANFHLWALHMVDAWAKPPEGILSGHINPMGDYDECVGIEAKNTINLRGTKYDFNGKYCTVYIFPKPDLPQSPEFAGVGGNDTSSINAVSPAELLELMSILLGVIVLPTMGVCLPDTCPNPDILKILENGFKILGFLPGVAAPTIDMCYVKKKPDLDTADISVISFLALLVLLCFLSGVIDIILNRGVAKPPRRSLGMQYLMAFSFYTNIRKWLATGGGGGDDLGCVHGIRFLSTCWVVLAHTWYMVTFVPHWNMVDLKTVHESWPIMLILNSTVSVDTFFALSGLLVCYAVLKTLDKQKGSLNIPLFYLHRYLRLTPTYAILIAMMATIFPYLGSGPFWKIMDRWSNICENNWWTNILYVNNFVNTSYLCQGEAWYLANDFQFYVFSPVVLYPLWKWAPIGIGLLVLLTVASVLCPGLMVHEYGIVPTTIGTRDIQQWFLDVYIKPWPRVQTYLVGIAVGYMLYRTKGKKVHIPRLVQLVCWIISTGTCIAVLFGMYPYFDPKTPIPPISSFFYASFNRFGWAVSIGWIIFACVKGYGGLINSFLSWKVFVPLGRLCFCAFLVSLHLQMILHLSFRQAITFEPYTMVNFFFAHLIMSFGVAFICTITMESPFIQISKLMFEGGAPRQIQNIAKPGLNERYGIFYNNQDTVINTGGGGKGK